MEMDEDFKKAVEFHGHICPGIAIGYRVAKYIKEHYPRAEDEELVAIVENNSCSVDAIQSLLGCTFGKGNLIFKDHGKQVFTFYSRNDGKAIRVYFKNSPRRPSPDVGREEMEKMRKEMLEMVLSAKDEDILDIKEVEIPAPLKARIYPSLVCQNCNEYFMEIRGHTVLGKIVCEECFQKLTA